MMEYKYEYTTSEERETILNDHIDLVLHEEQNIDEGNFLIFIDTDTAKQLENEYLLLSEQRYTRDRINTLLNYTNLDMTVISDLEEFILLREQNKTTGGVK
jgi:hypothetical protein